MLQNIFSHRPPSDKIYWVLEGADAADGKSGFFKRERANSAESTQSAIKHNCLHYRPQAKFGAR